MRPFTKHTGLVALMDRSNVDTDQIIPKQFLKRIERTGFGEFLFFDWRYRDDGTDNPDFELNQPRYRGASILVARKNFGCGSSREHAPWASGSMAARFAESFADIFFNNCFKTACCRSACRAADRRPLHRVAASPGCELTVDLQTRTITGPEGLRIPFEVDDFRRHCLSNGLDDIGLTPHEDKITAYEKAESTIRR